MKIKEILSHFENRFPLSYQEDFDNSGIQCGDKEREATGALVCFEMSEETIDEAIAQGANLVISHHPLVLRKGIQKIEPTNRIGRIICKALENKMVLYSMHTNLDSAPGGVNDLFAEKLGLQNVRVLCPQEAGLSKIAFFVPADYAQLVKDALFEIGCGRLNAYEKCAYSVQGIGTFTPLAEANPFIGKAGETEQVKEERVEMVFPTHLQQKVIGTLYATHPYEEPAFDIYRLENTNNKVGLGRIGELAQPADALDFLRLIKKRLGVEVIRYFGNTDRPIQKIAVCGGGGSSFINDAMRAGADLYVSGDIKYHDFHTADRKMLIADIGHFESEQFIKEIIYSEIKKNFTNFAVSTSEIERMKISII